jgi:hypothetical protein
LHCRNTHDGHTTLVQRSYDVTLPTSIVDEWLFRSTWKIVCSLFTRSLCNLLNNLSVRFEYPSFLMDACASDIRDGLVYLLLQDKGPFILPSTPEITPSLLEEPVDTRSARQLYLLEATSLRTSSCVRGAIRICTRRVRDGWKVYSCSFDSNLLACWNCPGSV